ncbi:EAL domain-containing protein [Clostridioides sp. ES-W-0016-02]|uniref:EAL domain-containing protein n=1 Tax=Clostridioides sp. ES-W-0016-02 TaxID=2770788 RepID=UPI001D11CF05|nr:EAL domain-containing protein [Clostridioides sp. ES-W-0016-02]
MKNLNPCLNGENIIIPALKNILIVDDNKVNRQILNKILSSQYNIIEAENGEVALSILHQNHENISVVLLDIIMPVLNGYELLKRMHEDIFLSKIPTIVTSGQNSEDAEIKALSLGANDYIIKPYKPEIIKHRVSNTIYLRETSAFINLVQNDSLTSTFSKEYFYMCVAETLQSNPQKQYDLICLDIERFKLVNDMYGIKVGDDLLKHVGKTLISIVNEYGICGRIAADEFICLVPHCEEYQNEYFKNITEMINGFSDTIKINLILRYGIYCIEDRSTPINIMCDRANLAKESIKGKYDTYFAYYDDNIRQKLLDEQMIVSDMKNALIENQFKVYFQPKYDLKTQEIVGAEALVRWIHPTKGFMLPSNFIPIFEKNGFITDLDIYVWDQCCQKIRAWIDMGYTSIPISINVSRADIYNPSIVEILISMIQKYKLSPKNLHLEITETAYTENPEQLIEVVLKLKKIGFIIEMDDFGTGYSSLNMLSELPIDVLKLDMRFIKREEKKNNDRSILSFIISLAKWMDLKVIAEGVETEVQVQLLKALNCEYAQGYYYSKPLPQEQFEQHLLKSHIQVVNKNKKECQHFVKNFKDKKNIMLVLDPDSVDFSRLKKDYKYQFFVEHVHRASDAIDFIIELEEKISVLIVSISKYIRPKQMLQILDVCKKINVTVIVLYDKIYDKKNKILSMDIYDYVERPYDLLQLNLRIQNAIAFAKMKKFEYEKEVNSTIIEMRKRAEHDALTGLLNRAEYEVRIDNFFHNNYNPSGIFVILDIDNFKSINDTYGHVVGDKVLYMVAEMIKHIFPETDIIGRIGGDEFSLFIPYTIPFLQLQEKMIHICKPNNLDVNNITISCSAGVCLTPDYGINRKELYKNADIALLLAKRHGKSKFEIFSQGMKLPTPSSLENKSKYLLTMF